MPISTSLAHRASLSARSAACSKSFPLALRSYAIPPGATPSPLPASATIPTATAPNSVVQKRVVPTVATPTSQATASIPVVPVVPPPSDSNLITPVELHQKKKGSYKGKAGWILFTVLNSYIIATYVALHNDTFEEIYTQYIPGGGAIFDWAEDNELDKVGVASAVDAYNKVADTSKSIYRGITGQTFTPPPTSTNPNHSSERLAALQKSMSSSASDLKAKAASAAEPITQYASDVKDRAVKAPAKDFEASKASTPTKGEDARAKAFAAVDDSKLVLERKTEEARKKAEEAKKEAEAKVEEAKAKAEELKKDVVNKVTAAEVAVEKKALEIKDVVVEKAHDLKEAVVGTPHSFADLKEEALKGIENIKAAGGVLSEKAADIFDATKVETEKARAWVWSEGVEDLVNQAESALGLAKEKAESKVEEVKDAVGQVKKDLAPVAAGDKVPWTGGPLPLGFEPPPGYFVPRSSTTSSSSNGDALPLIAPKVQSFSTSEPIISQLASTIDSLASYLSSHAPQKLPTTSSYTSAEQAKKLIDNAVGDLEALGGRLQKVQEDAKKELESGLERKRVEFENEVKRREDVLESELEKREEGWKGVVEDERRRLVEVFREKLERELEAQSEIINERLKEEVLAQGIELQRRWIREIKLQVETERGGRLSKLEGLEKGLKDLEKVTLDNSAVLDENVKLHTLWSALRAVQSAIDAPRQPFTTQLAALSSLSRSSSSSSSSSTISTALSSIPTSTSSTGVETLPDLTYWFTTKVAPRIRSVALVPEAADSGVLSHLASAILSPVLFRKSGNVEGTDVASVLARAEDRLSRKDLDGAAREVNSLKGWAGRLAGDWLREARKRLEVEQALEVVATEATLSSLLLV